MRKKPTVVLVHPLHPDAVQETLKPHARVILARSKEALRRALPQADALLSVLTFPVTKSVLDLGPKLRVVGNMAVGVDNIDLRECARRGIAVVNTPDVLTRATAELTVALLFAVARRVPEGESMCRRGKFLGWQPDLLLGLELRGRRAVIVGKGRIGRESARLFRGLGLKVEFIEKDASESRIRAVLQRAQILSLHLPLRKETRHWLNADRFRHLPKDCILLNTCRGPVIDEETLIQALKSRRIFGAGLDVFEQEPHIPHALRSLPNTVLLPHLGSATQETRRAMAILAIRGVLSVLNGKKPKNQVSLNS